MVTEMHLRCKGWLKKHIKTFVFTQQSNYVIQMQLVWVEFDPFTYFFMNYVTSLPGILVLTVQRFTGNLEVTL